MGFSVTVTHAIFFIAALSAGSIAMDALWETSAQTTEARARWTGLSADQVDTNLTLTVNSCNNGCNPATPADVDIELDVRNSGTTVVDYRNLTYILDGTLHTVTNVSDYDIISPASVSGTDLIIPGETMRIQFSNIVITADYLNDGSNLPVQVITLEGVIGRR